jgi:hypothetical protein
MAEALSRWTDYRVLRRRAASHFPSALGVETRVGFLPTFFHSKGRGKWRVLGSIAKQRAPEDQLLCGVLLRA